MVNLQKKKAGEEEKDDLDLQREQACKRKCRLKPSLVIYLWYSNDKGYCYFKMYLRYKEGLPGSRSMAMAVTLCGRPTLLCCSCSFVYCLSSRIPSKRTLCIVVSEKKSYHAVPPPKSISSERILEEHPQYGRRKILLRSSEIAALAAILNLFRGTKPKFLGVQKNPPSLALCPATPNCISTAEELNDPSHYVPPWNYNAEDKRARNEPATKEQAMSELLDVILSTKPDNYTPHIVEKTTDYVRVEYESPFLGFVDDVEFWFPPGKSSIVEYRSASRFGNYDFDINRKRIKALRLALQKKGWESVGY